MARQIAGTLGLQVAWLPEPLARYPVGSACGKEDLMLKRLAAVIRELEARD